MRQLSRAIRAAAATAEIEKRVSMHLLRHSLGNRDKPSNLPLHKILAHGYALFELYGQEHLG
jgi:hypothetical protein